MGAAGALVLAAINRRLTFGLMKQGLDSTARLSAFVMFILIGSSVFALVFRAVNGDLWVEHLLTSLPGGNAGFLIAVNLLFFGLGFFLDFFEIAFILVPLVGPVAEKLGIDLIWFGVLISVNLQTSFMTPPFGFALFYLRSVTPKEVKTGDIYMGMVPFILIQVVVVAGILAFPQLIDVGTPVNMKEKLELNIEVPGFGGDYNYEQPELNFSTPAESQEPGEDSENGGNGEEDLQLNFSTN
jgi:tripartite ATP-independent transporter DctM subunit